MDESEAIRWQQTSEIAPFQLWIVKVAERIYARYRMAISEEAFTQMRSDEPGTSGD